MKASIGAATGLIAVTTLVSSCWAQHTIEGEAPVLTWNRIALESVERAKPTQHEAARLFAYLSLAQHAALAGNPDSEAARAAVAGVSMRVIAGLLPSQAGFVEAHLVRWQPKDEEATARIASRLLAQAAGDGFTAKWSGQTPQGAFAWRSLAATPASPAYPAIGGMRTLIIDAGDVFRPAPPPALGSAQFAEALAEVRHHTLFPSAETSRLAKRYDMTTGTLAAGFWNEQAVALLTRERVNEHRASIVLATMNAAIMDALVACHDAKYAYWFPRPSQADPAIKALIGVPNHPSYPSNHACLSTAAAKVLAHFFPQDRERLEQIGDEARVSRIYAGLHYRFDVDAGEEIGAKVAATAIARRAQRLGETTERLLAAPDSRVAETSETGPGTH